MGNRASRKKNLVGRVVGGRKKIRARLKHAEQMPFAMTKDKEPPLPTGCMKATEAEAEDAQLDRELAFREAADPALMPMLQIAVPMWMERHRTASFETLKERAAACAEKISRGDAIERRVKRGASASLFNAIAEGLAVATLNSPDGSLSWCGLRFSRDFDLPVAADEAKS